MHNLKKGKVEAIVKQFLIAFFFSAFFVFLVSILFQKKIDKAIVLINKIAVVSSEKESKKKNIRINSLKKRLVEYPSYGDVFGSIKIPTLEIESNIYHGDALRLLKYGVGHHAGTYFPGEGGTILIAGHNTYAQFRNLPNIKVNDQIIIEAVYGNYTYKVDRTDILEAKDFNEQLSINDTKEELILYTCYPVDIPGFKTKRFIVYASLVGDSK